MIEPQIAGSQATLYELGRFVLISGLGIKSGALMADSKQTELCTYLSAILLSGLLLNALLGWWWADPVAAIIMVPIIVKEGIEALRGETCCDEDTCR